MGVRAFVRFLEELGAWRVLALMALLAANARMIHWLEGAASAWAEWMLSLLAGLPGVFLAFLLVVRGTRYAAPEDRPVGIAEDS